MIVSSDPKIRADGNRLKLACQCGACQFPFGYVQNGVLVIQSSHYGQSHINVLTLGEVEQLLKEARQQQT